MAIQLVPPLRHVYITQPFGVNYLDFYKKLGLKGHNGIDLFARNGCPVLAAHNGVVIWSGADIGGGISIEILSQRMGEGYKTIYYHLCEATAKEGELVRAGQVIGKADNTGKYTTGDHLHFGMKLTKAGQTTNANNGYGGAVDPYQYFPKDWDQPPVFHRYGRKRTAETFKTEVKVMLALRRFLGRIPSHEQINACAYGYWNREAVANIAMRELWAYLTKIEYEAGQRPFA